MSAAAQEPLNQSASEAFEQAVLESKQLTSKPSSDDLLELYALYKVARGEDITKADKPGMFDLKGKAKKAAWEKVVAEGISVEEAQERYVTKVAALKQAYGFDSDKAPEVVGLA